MCINKSQTVLVDLSPLQLQLQTSRTYFSTSFWHRWELGRAKWEILVPLTALLFHHPQCLQNRVSMAPRNLLHTEPFTHRSFYTQELLHTDAFTHRRFYTQTLLHRHFLHTEVPFYLSFRRSNFISCERVVADPWKSQFYSQFFPRAPAKGSS